MRIISHAHTIRTQTPPFSAALAPGITETDYGSSRLLFVQVQFKQVMIRAVADFVRIFQIDRGGIHCEEHGWSSCRHRDTNR